jgi:homogentisate 1,2-dioxygenase
MSEFMGLIRGRYDAKVGFVPGGASLHNCMTPHGPDAPTYRSAVEDECLTPTVFEGGLAFMFETCLPLRVSPLALDDGEWRDLDYNSCWQDLGDNFTGWDLLRRAEQGEEES